MTVFHILDRLLLHVDRNPSALAAECLVNWLDYVKVFIMFQLFFRSFGALAEINLLPNPEVISEFHRCCAVRRPVFPVFELS